MFTVDWVPVSNCSCPHLYLYVAVLGIRNFNFKQTNDVSKKTGEDNNKLGLEPRLCLQQDKKDSWRMSVFSVHGH